ncbi:MAG: aminotransferase class III-fold pyridoxal phosphate-dependent enzyme, partial [Bacteroidetes bacterium]|nr:aminotransferase class III-fold pyridoxal phosphate-dependent enzyme [Bacteroidota bacterium]
MSNKHYVSSHKQDFLNHLAQTSDFPSMLEIEYADGVYMFEKAFEKKSDKTGTSGTSRKKYIDLISGIGVNNVGHRHPEVIKAIKEQLDKYLHLMAYGELVQTPQVMLAKKLAENLPAQLECTYFVNSGSEAVEGAIKLAKRFTGRTGIISLQNAYHGSTHGALSLNGSEVFKRAFRPLLPEVRHIKFNDTEDLEHITDKIAAVIIEPIQGEAGVIIPDKEYLKTLRNKCSNSGTLLIFD